MKTEQKANTMILRHTEGDCQAFVMKVTHEYKSFENFNLILDVSQDENVTNKSMTLFVPLSKVHRKAKKSFVVVAENIEFNKVPASLVVVPSMLEAHDMIEMEEIERDLGF